VEFFIEVLFEDLRNLIFGLCEIKATKMMITHLSKATGFSGEQAERSCFLIKSGKIFDKGIDVFKSRLDK